MERYRSATCASPSAHSEMTSHRIRATANKLGLPHLAEALNQYTRRADEAKMGYLDLLDLMLAEEPAVREDRRFRNGLRLSKLPHHKAKTKAVRVSLLLTPVPEKHSRKRHAGRVLRLSDRSFGRIVRGG